MFLLFYLSQFSFSPLPSSPPSLSPSSILSSLLEAEPTLTCVKVIRISASDWLLPSDDLSENVGFFYPDVCLSSACSTRQEVDSPAGSGDARREEVLKNTTSSGSASSTTSSSASSTFYSVSSSLMKQSQTEVNSGTEESRPLLGVNKNDVCRRSESRKVALLLCFVDVMSSLGSQSQHFQKIILLKDILRCFPRN